MLTSLQSAAIYLSLRLAQTLHLCRPGEGDSEDAQRLLASLARLRKAWNVFAHEVTLDEQILKLVQGAIDWCQQTVFKAKPLTDLQESGINEACAVKLNQIKTLIETRVLPNTDAVWSLPDWFRAGDLLPRGESIDISSQQGRGSNHLEWQWDARDKLAQRMENIKLDSKHLLAPAITGPKPNTSALGELPLYLDGWHLIEQRLQAIAKEAKSPIQGRRPSQNEERDQWLYSQASAKTEDGVWQFTWEQIRSNLEALVGTNRQWKGLESVQALRLAVNRYAERHGLSQITRKNH